MAHPATPQPSTLTSRSCQRHFQKQLATSLLTAMHEGKRRRYGRSCRFLSSSSELLRQISWKYIMRAFLWIPQFVVLVGWLRTADYYLKSDILPHLRVRSESCKNVAHQKILPYNDVVIWKRLATQSSKKSTKNNILGSCTIYLRIGWNNLKCFCPSLLLNGCFCLRRR